VRAKRGEGGRVGRAQGGGGRMRAARRVDDAASWCPAALGSCRTSP
jgi:hypothetical protein